MKLIIITVGYRSGEHIKQLFESLKKQTDKEFSLILINNSQDDSDEIKKLSEQYSFVSFTANPINSGFAGGNNIGIKKAAENQADWLVLLNPDTHVENDFITGLKKELTQRSGVVGIPIQEENKVVYNGTVEWLKPTLRHSDILRDIRMSYAIGGAMAISREAIQKIGLLDERYFLYFEDADYSLRAREQGISVSFLSQPVVSHAVSASTKKLGSSMLLRYHMRNALYFNHRHAPWHYQLLIPFWSFFVGLKQAAKIIIGRKREASIAILKGILDFHLDHTGQISGFTKSRIKLGIECENLEDPKSRWGVGHMVLNLLEEYTKDKSLQDKYELHLYFKDFVPNDSVLQNPVFKKKVIGGRFFNVFYHIVLPIRAMFDSVDWMFFPAYMLPPLYFGKSIVMLTDDVYHEYRHGSLPFRYRLAYGLFTNWAALFANKILCISEASAKEVSRLYDISRDHIFVAHLGTTSKGVAGAGGPFEYLLYIGQMFPRRRAYESLLAFDKIAPEFPELKFILVGRDKYDPPHIAETVALINKKLGSERVIYYDYIERDDEIASLYANAKLFAYISSREAFGLPLVEAAGHGVPIVAKDCALNRELFADAAFFVRDEQNIDEIAAVFKEGLTDTVERKRMIEAYKTLIPKLNWQSFAQKFFEQIQTH